MTVSTVVGHLLKAGTRDMARYGTWITYSGSAKIALAIVLLIAAGGVAYAGTRLALPVRAPLPRKAIANFMLAAWVFAITAFLACFAAYGQQARRDHLLHARPPDPITPVTFTSVGVIFLIIVLISRSYDWPVRLAGAAIGALAAPMIFEFPFDLVVMARIYPPIPPDPALYRVLFFAPLFLVEITTVSLLALSPMVKLFRASFFYFAAILAVFAVWGLFGFGYPSTPLPYALNVLSKILAFVTALSLFLPQRARASATAPGPQPQPEPRNFGAGIGDFGVR
jgi:hypothetical protein